MKHSPCILLLTYFFSSFFALVQYLVNYNLNYKLNSSGKYLLACSITNYVLHFYFVSEIRAARHYHYKDKKKFAKKARTVGCLLVWRLALFRTKIEFALCSEQQIEKLMFSLDHRLEMDQVKVNLITTDYTLFFFILKLKNIQQVKINTYSAL